MSTSRKARSQHLRHICPLDVYWTGAQWRNCMGENVGHSPLFCKGARVLIFLPSPRYDNGTNL